MRQFLIIVEKAGRGYSTYSPDLPGCISTGKTRQQAVKNMREAIAFHLEGMMEDGLTIPRGTATASQVHVNAPTRRGRPTLPIGTSRRTKTLASGRHGNGRAKRP